MKRAKWKIYGIFILITEAVGALSGFLTRGSMEQFETLEKPPLTPPGSVFPIVWGILFLLMGIGAAKIYMAEPSEERTKSLNIFWLQLAVNFFWSIFFFNLRLWGFSFFWLLILLVLILIMILSFRKTVPFAAWLQIPYLLWVAFAGYLNYMIWMMNS